jgi:hypothetical protein
MKRAMTILVYVLAAGLASAQSPQIIQHTKTKLDGVSEKATAASNEALQKTTAVPDPKAKPRAAKLSAEPAPAKAVPAATAAKTSQVAPKSALNLKPTSALPGKSSAVRAAVLATKPVIVVPKTSPAVPSEQAQSGDKKTRTWEMNGRRDPFVSPVVSQSSGSKCSTGKKCLEIGAVNLRGVVRSENGFIAVVTNNMNKAYFLRENDPVFDGYVVKITGDSIVFQETLQDNLGKTYTREVVKKITTPAV